MKSKPYAKYKPSNVKWLGEVPEHWEVKRLKHISSVRGRIGFRGYTTDDLVEPDEGALVLGGANLSLNGKIDLNKQTYITWNKYYESPEIQVEMNDIIIGQRGTCGNPILIDQELGPTTINPSLVLLKAGRVESSYLCFWLMGKFTGSIITTLTSSTAVPMLSQEQIGNFPVLLPPQTEQQAIAAFLDRETERIDKLIGKKQKLAELLKEKRTALISRAVTKGLNPKVKMKPSGVEWLGEVPEHWEIIKLKYSFSLCTQKAVSDDKPIALENIESWTGRYIRTDSEFEGEGIFFTVNDILFGKLRPYLAKVYLAEEPGESVGDIFVLRPSKQVFAKYAAVILRTRNYIEVIDGSTYGSKMPRASWEFMGNLPFILPPLPEQQAIATFLDRETAKIDKLVAKVETVIDKLKEYRTALISAAVTGKIDVRDAA